MTAGLLLPGDRGPGLKRIGSHRWVVMVSFLVDGSEASAIAAGAPFVPGLDRVWRSSLRCIDCAGEFNAMRNEGCVYPSVEEAR